MSTLGLYAEHVSKVSDFHIRPKHLVAATTGLPSISEVISNRRSALFGHVARLQQDVPAHKALHCHVDLSLGRPPNDQ